MEKSEKVVVKTNDPRRPDFRLTLSGWVERFASIEPGFVYFRGEAKDVEAVELEVTPNSTDGFHITRVVADKPHLFSAELIEPCKQENAPCRIRVTNRQKNAGKYVGVIKVTTDSMVQPSFIIVVRANLSS